MKNKSFTKAIIINKSLSSGMNIASSATPLYLKNYRAIKTQN